MRKEKFIIPAAILLAVGIIGCSTAVDGVKDSVSPMSTQAATVDGSDSVDLVCVHGKSEVRVVPDKASISIGVEVRSATADAANTDLSNDTDAVLKALKDAGVAETDITTEYYDVTEDYHWTENEGQVSNGFIGSTYITVRGLEIDNVSSIISTAMAAGADSTSQVQYYSSEYKQAYDEALMHAIDEAKAKADKMGEAAGFKVVRVHKMEEGYFDDSARYTTNSMKEAYADTEGAGGMSAGDLAIEANVTVEYVIQ